MLFVCHSRTGHSSSHSKCQCGSLVLEPRVFVCCVGTISLHVGFKHGLLIGHMSCHKKSDRLNQPLLTSCVPCKCPSQNNLFSCHPRVTCQTLETHSTCKGTHSKYHPSSLTSSGDKLRFHPIPNVEQKTFERKINENSGNIIQARKFLAKGVVKYVGTVKTMKKTAVGRWNRRYLDDV